MFAVWRQKKNDAKKKIDEVSVWTWKAFGEWVKKLLFFFEMGCKNWAVGQWVDLFT